MFWCCHRQYIEAGDDKKIIPNISVFWNPMCVRVRCVCETKIIVHASIVGIFVCVWVRASEQAVDTYYKHDDESCGRGDMRLCDYCARRSVRT